MALACIKNNFKSSIYNTANFGLYINLDDYIIQLISVEIVEVVVLELENSKKPDLDIFIGWRKIE
ncbi:hypothetical protein [Methanospirillum lacunae]|uniref:Uncharacterized protein n=1 Tax=Methanospirillum lacunae TaxID=668570 RepID=A0A2V2MVN2_9EURY|nr:hypothetical protein [Methanospirillum lacunae]PWR71419.1 hypothetical protein DK846_11175 [Methanospirillum lacunae]